MRYFALIFFAVGFVFTIPLVLCAEPAMLDNHQNGDNIEVLPVERLIELKIGQATLADVHAIFGSREERRQTFQKTLLPKFYKNTHYQVYRLVSYSSFSVSQKNLRGNVETTWTESVNVTFFFDKNNKLLFYTVRHRLKDDKHNQKSGKYHNIIGDPDEFWPGSVCDGMFHGIYETQRYKGSEYFGPVTTQKCQWLDKLKADVASGAVK